MSCYRKRTYFNYKRIKNANKKIFETAQKIGDDLSCLYLYKLENGRIRFELDRKRHSKIDIRTLEEGFWIGIGEITTDLSLIE